MKNRSQRLTEQARRQFATHQISKRSAGRWLLQRRYNDNTGWDWTMAAEVISLVGGALFVGGDIFHVIFGWYSDSADHGRKLRWMGKCDDIEYYVHQKAVIGTGRELVDVYDENAARDYVDDWSKQERKDGNIKLADKLQRLLEPYGGIDWENGHGIVQELADELGWDEMSERYGIGQVMADRVYYAHAALRRLCEILDAE